jgi:cardiolipin synthase
METNAAPEFTWLETGGRTIQEMLAAITAAQQSIRLETYIFQGDATGEEFREALVGACNRGVRVQVLADAVGSIYLSDSFWKLFRLNGGQIRWFNPLSLSRPSIRDHRKLLVCDESVAIIGGINIAGEYRGDGVKGGWRDLGMKIRGGLANVMARAFDQMFDCADFKHKPFARLRKSARQKIVHSSEGQLLLGGPGRNSPIKRALLQDLRTAREVAIVSAYFLPPWRMRRDLARLARRGAKVRLILPGKSDVAMSRLAGQSFYRRFLKAGVEIYEYQPQILHAKLFIIDDVAYAGSANLDGRSLSVNYEIMVRLPNAALAAQGRGIFSDLLQHCRRIELAQWRRCRTFWERLKARVAYFILARLEPFLAQRQMRD